MPGLSLAREISTTEYNKRFVIIDLALINGRALLAGLFLFEPGSIAPGSKCLLPMAARFHPMSHKPVRWHSWHHL